MELADIALLSPDLEPLERFYVDALGLDWERDGRGAQLQYDGTTIARLREDDTNERDAAAAGLFHLAIRFGDRQDLAGALRRLRQEGYELLGSADHVVSEALYLADPDGNGVELYRDRPQEEWEWNEDGTVKMTNRYLDVEELVSELRYDPDQGYSDAALGHVHLEGIDLDASLPFYRDVLGMDVTARLPGALFFAWGRYHHHIGLNTWNRRSEQHDPSAVGLSHVGLRLDDGERDAVTGRLAEHDMEYDTEGDALVLTDPNGVRFRLR